MPRSQRLLVSKYYVTLKPYDAAVPCLQKLSLAVSFSPSSPLDNEIFIKRSKDSVLFIFVALQNVETQSITGMVISKLRNTQTIVSEPVLMNSNIKNELYNNLEK